MVIPINEKNQRVGIKLPDGTFVELLYLNKSHDGYILGVPDSDRHVTLLIKNDELSTHSTDQTCKSSNHIGELNKEIIEKEGTGFLVERIVDESEYENKILYVTKKWESFLTNFQNKYFSGLFKTERRKKYDLTYFDTGFLLNISNDDYFLNDIKEHPENYFGICQIKELFNNPFYTGGVTTQGKIVKLIDSQIHELNFPIFNQDENPLIGIVKDVLGFDVIQEEVIKKLEKL